ncbi:DUF4062 domain-containing protein [Pseudomonas fluorescens]|uniref:DUF4062 domain-containing protein n=1 Tax=Pseudomonas fluorescens TaxID=294 RepID=A0A2N1E8B6_PSEFL|nr:DUF4062 domain-containing protein [Pseudomonas fluorescens]MBD8100641.1 DUF4062 domain-containing protein [Pseudomonas fluorescens]MBD8777241.1 DUF4062 domain-containing protein [Pseudomonas fluorescens]MBD8782404.1 DUF4062 domain-containing protein [Pseudomonas fluorescens]MBD8798663.1 DUF4062 domain-containing protein [Pseudomonas fluorescens]PKH21985.1 hypothetical protein CIB54_09865 [Pseudomonas fluorescens]
MSKKYQVFISSTFQDLRDHRDQAMKAVLDMGHIPMGMEMFSAADEEQWAIITRQIRDSDYYVLIVAHRYGSLDTQGISYTEKEYDYAISLGVPILAFIISDGALWPNDQQEPDSDSRKKLTDFKRKIKTKLIQFWQNKDELHGKISIALMKAITAYPRTGWIRADEVAGPEVTRELTRLSHENSELRTELENHKKTQVLQEDEVHASVRILSSNKMYIRIRKTSKWENGKIHETTLANIFQHIGPHLLGENSKLGIAQNIALGLSGTGYFKNYPVGSNIVAGILADLAALDLVEPSKKKHSLSDNAEYWSLTTLGKKVIKNIRRFQLEAGLPSIVEASETSDDTTEPV